MNPPFATLRGLARQVGPARPPEPPSRCELCGQPLPEVHRHLLEMTAPGRNVACACGPCALLFQRDGAGGGRFKLIPREARLLPGFAMSDAEWDDLALPIGLAFFFQSSPAGKLTALYPGPAGATESLLPLAAWEALAGRNPALAAMEPDVEALLVNRTGGAGDYFIAPIDACYELAGTIRLHWRGLHGGDEVWTEIAAFFARLRETALPLPQDAHERKEAARA